MTSANQSRFGGAKVRVPPPLVFLAGVLLGGLVDRYVRPWPLPLPGAVRLALAALMAIAGAALIGWAMVHFRRTGQNPEPWKPSPELIPDGPYRFTRNPMYVGMLLIELGLGCLLDSVWILLCGPLTLLTVHFLAVLPEERYLTEKFGEPYLRFKQQIPRYLGF